MQPDRVRGAGRPAKAAGQRGAPAGMRGWLLVYTVVLAILLLHGAELTIASIVIYAHPAAGLHSFVSLGFLLFYVITNVILILYIIYLFRLMFRRRKAAIVNNIVFSILSVLFLVSWHFFGEKSNIGTFVDAAPNIIGAAYIMLSRRVRDTFTIGPRPAATRLGPGHMPG
jgi:Protein of unknown function (DUF2569)